MLKVKIIKCNDVWYKNEIGNIFNVDDKPIELNNHLSFSVIQNGVPTALCIRIDDCEEITE